MNNNKLSVLVLGLLVVIVYIALKAVVILSVIIFLLSQLISITSVGVIGSIIISLILALVMNFKFEDKIFSKLNNIFLDKSNSK
ncbi:hypothetical protein CWD94_04120 [Lysinibacillus xylanilyticus]|uniref:Uncharacterized protein n=1 Tax=Lysinibacillus xylanilyticus TaxID=582475 RepID=A0A2M9Q9Z1_9BACI|nr:hypothetical protein CWD94_04120 [Lysinibacillus xylanilyticus]